MTEFNLKGQLKEIITSKKYDNKNHIHFEDFYSIHCDKGDSTLLLIISPQLSPQLWQKVNTHF